MLNVLYQFNEKYVPYAAVSMVSLLMNNIDIDDITIYMVGEKVSKESQYKLLKQIREYGRTPVFIDAEALVKKMKNVGINDYRGSCATNMKMFVDDFIPVSVDRLLYIDCDTIIEGSLKELSSLDMQRNPIAMVLDSMCARHKLAIGFRKEDNYFNGGVILYDMFQWRKQNCTEKLLTHIKKVRSHYMAPDQDLINIVLKGHITMLDVAYNLQPIHSVYSYKQYSLFFGQPGYYLEKEVEEALKHPAIYHIFRYLGEFPWHADNLHPNNALFDKYLANSLWADYEKQLAEQNDFVFRVERWLYRVLPRLLFLMIFKFFYEFFMWKSNRDSVRQVNNARM